MPTATLNSSDTALTQQPLAAGSTLIVNVTPRTKYETTAVEILNHGSMVVYAKAMPTVTTDDPAATVIAPSGWATLNTADRIAITATGDTTITVQRADTAHTRLTDADIALNKRITDLVLGITTIGRCDFLTVTIALMGSATYTCTLDRPMPNTTYAVSMPTVAGSAFEVLSKTTTTVTLKQTANAVAVTAGLRLLLLAYA